MKRAVMGPSAWLVVLLLAACPAIAAPLSPGLEQDAVPGALLEGTVVNSQNGRPVPRATVFVRNIRQHNSTRSVQADGQGHFSIAHLYGGTYQLIADQLNFFSDDRRHAFRPTIHLSENEERKDILVKLMPAGVVTGTLVNESGDNMARVTVKLLKREVHRGRMSIVTTGLGLTDDRGEYRIYGVPPGHYYVLAEAAASLRTNSKEIIAGGGIVGIIDRSGLGAFGTPGFGGQGEAAPESEVTYPPLFYPGTSDFQQAMELPVSPGDEIHANFVAFTMPAVAIHGVVLNGVTGERAKNATVAAYWTDIFGKSGGNFTGTTHSDGTFEIRGLPPGLYTVRTSFSDETGGNEAASFIDEQTVEVGVHGRDAVMLAGLPESHVAGQVVLASSNPRDNTMGMGNVSVRFSPLHAVGDVVVAAKGPNFILEARLKPLEPYTVSVSGLKDDFYLKSVLLSGHAVDGNTLTPAARDHVDIVLSPNGGHIDGAVFDDRDQPASAYVMLIPDAPNRSDFELLRNARSDSKGKFVLRGVPPGTYTLIAFEGLTPDELMNDPETFKDYLNRGDTVLVTEGGKYQMQARLIPVE